MDYYFPSLDFFHTGWKHWAIMMIKKQQDAVFTGEGIHLEVAQLDVSSSIQTKLVFLFF